MTPAKARRSAVLLAMLGAVVAAPLVAQQTLTVFAAASLTEAFTTLAQRFEAAHPGITVRLNLGGSQALVTQLVHGARADVLATADQRWMARAADEGLLAADPVLFARNALVVVLPGSNPGRVARLEDLARPGLKLILAGIQVPVGAYGREALRRLAAAPGFPGDYERQVLQNLVSEEENVKAVLAKVQLGEADAGIVYRSDVTDGLRPQVHLLEIPERYNPIAEYPVAPVKGGRGMLAQAFIALLRSEEGRQVLGARGFLAPAAAP